MRRFVVIDLGRESAPDETTICRFRHLLERHNHQCAEFDQEQGSETGSGEVSDQEGQPPPGPDGHRACEEPKQVTSLRQGRAPLPILKRVFGFSKLRYRGLDKNANRLFVACGLVQFVHGAATSIASYIGFVCLNVANEPEYRHEWIRHSLNFQSCLCSSAREGGSYRQIS